MKVSFSIKERNRDTGQWLNIDANALAGKPLAEALASLAGREAVAEFIFGDECCYLCGTEFWRERMARKGHAALFDQAAEILRQRRPDLLEEIIPHVDTIAGVFEGITVQRVHFPENA